MSDINQLSHDERGLLIRDMPRAENVLLSAGCAGTWYFNWINEVYGHVPSHIGVEFYTPPPERLDDNVTWIANTAGDMRDVGDASVDVLFSGQNLEHLWPSETIGFFLEAARTVRAGGFIVVDSPNRLITEELCWSHPEHTIEFTPEEATKLATLSGFDVTAMKGIWTVRNPETGQVLPFDRVEVEGWSIERRCKDAYNDPDNAFIWWMEAVRSDRAPDAAGLRAFVIEVFNIAWPERLERYVTPDEKEGVMVFGPYFPLPDGDYNVTFDVTPENPSGAKDKLRCDVVQGDTILEPAIEMSAADVNNPMEIAFTLTEKMNFGMQFRMFRYGGYDVSYKLPKITGATAAEVLAKVGV
jgi:hypothetical protein